MSGVVLLDGTPASKPSQSVADGVTVTLAAEPEPWVGRAAHKLLAALEQWPIRVAGRSCLDVGASTGGFTQVLLAHDAAQVIALDVGHGQLVPEIAEDPRVTDLPGTNIRDVDAAQFGRHDLVVTDLSFISLRLVLPVLASLLEPDGDLVVLVKPQFEVGRERLGRGGVVASPHEHRRVLREVHRAVLDTGLVVVGAAPSPIAGSEGNREFLLWLRHAEPARPGLEVERTLAEAMPYAAARVPAPPSDASATGRADPSPSDPSRPTASPAQPEAAS